MPLLKIYVDESVETDKKSKLIVFLPSLRDQLCKTLNVESQACQFSIIAVHGLPDQAQLSVEISLLPKADRTRAFILSVCNQIRDVLQEKFQEKVAVRVVQLDPETYVVLR